MTTVKTDPVLEAIACKLSGYGTCPPEEQARMIKRAAKAALEAACAEAERLLSPERWTHPVSQWRDPVKDPPKHGQEVLFVLQGNRPCSGAYYNARPPARWRNSDGHEIYAKVITHWQPFPKLPHKRQAG